MDAYGTWEFRSHPYIRRSIKLMLAQRYAQRVRARHSSMQVKRIVASGSAYQWTRDEVLEVMREKSSPLVINLTKSATERQP